jgi:S1-C subfamily serine protease
MASQRPMHRSGFAATVGVIGLVAAAALVAMLGEHGAFSGSGATVVAIAPPIPGVTLDDSTTDRTPVVTSLRTHSEAERRGVRVGDRIAAVDGREVRDVAGLREAVERHSGAVPVSLQIQRGDAVWDVALDRAEPPGDRPDLRLAPNDPEDPARRGR